MSKYTDENVLVLVTETAKSTDFDTQKAILKDLSATSGLLPEFNYNELLAKLRHLSVNDESVQYHKAPAYVRKNKEQPRSKNLLTTDVEKAIEAILDYPVELTSLVNANRIDIVTILKALATAQTTIEEYRKQFEVE